MLGNNSKSSDFIIQLERMENGNYWSQNRRDDSAVIYTGEDARVLDVIFKYAGKINDA